MMGLIPELVDSLIHYTLVVFVVYVHDVIFLILMQQPGFIVK